MSKGSGCGVEGRIETGTYTNKNGEKVYYNETAYLGDTEYPNPPLTDAQLEEFRAFVDGAAAVNLSYDNDLMEIVNDEIGAFFAGDKSAEEVSKLIQSRVTIYLGETG